MLTRWDPDALAHGSRRASALHALGRAAFELRSVQELHAEVYLIDRWAYIGSANWTDRALLGGNLELGVELSGVDADDVAATVARWFERATPSGRIAAPVLTRAVGYERARRLRPSRIATRPPPGAQPARRCRPSWRSIVRSAGSTR